MPLTVIYSRKKGVESGSGVFWLRWHHASAPAVGILHRAKVLSELWLPTVISGLGWKLRSKAARVSCPPHIKSPAIPVISKYFLAVPIAGIMYHKKNRGTSDLERVFRIK